jgi:hypothetical protein
MIGRPRLSTNHLFFSRDWFEALSCFEKAFTRFTPSQKAANAGITNETIIQNKKNQ